MEHHVFEWIAQYGCPAIFCLLFLGMVGLPVPDETLITFAGYLVFRGVLRPVPVFSSVFLGSVTGITLSYFLGRSFGTALLHRYGRYVAIKAEHVKKAEEWYRRVGRWGLAFGYFVPGLRHFTAYAAGISHLELHQFAAYAYSGGFVWSVTFITLGYVLGERWEVVSRDINSSAALLTIVAAILLAACWLWRKRRRVQ